MVQPKYMGGLGFRDLELFNLALLAKQAWRIVQDAGFLSARVLKVVYFPNVDFMDAQLGSAPSGIWCSIIDGRGVLAEGLIRRVGTGETTHIWSMNWLPTNGMKRPIMCHQANPSQMVSELIDTTMAAWDKVKLHQWFTPADVEVIANIPLST